MLVGLYEETDKPPDALDFLRTHLHRTGSGGVDIDALKAEVEDLRKKNKDLTEENEQLKEALAKYEEEGNV